ncbi:MAG: glycosyltransferase [Anaerocolumna sp.]|nr:glycosyltransferase [Anaerocolumna sp.]
MAIVILNYMNYEDSLTCINCALRQKGEGYEIIVVDNGSENNSYDILMSEYYRIPNITLLRLEKNLGFAGGNNYGINYARKNFRADYIFVCNSDVTFTEDLFESTLALQIKGVGAISPPVFNNEEKPQPISITTNHIYLKIISTIIQMLINWLTYLPGIERLFKVYHSRKKVLPKKNKEEDYTKDINWNPNKFNLQGCAFFLTPEFFKYYEQLYPRTFLYWEEINLIVYLSKAHLQAVIKDLPAVIHKGKKSTTHLIKDNAYEKKRLEYSMKSMIKSLPMFFRSYVYILAKYN